MGTESRWACDLPITNNAAKVRLLGLQVKVRKNSFPPHSVQHSYWGLATPWEKFKCFKATMLWESYMKRSHADSLHIPRWGPNPQPTSISRCGKMVPAPTHQVTPKCWVLLAETLHIMEHRRAIPSTSCPNSWPTETMSTAECFTPLSLGAKWRNQSKAHSITLYVFIHGKYFEFQIIKVLDVFFLLL